MATTLPRYKCTQQELYTSSKKVTESLDSKLTDFKDFSPEYDPQFITTLLLQIETAEAMPDEQSRDEVTETQRARLSTATDTGLTNWQTLKRYCEKTWKDATLLKPKLEAAGINYYEKAANYDWEAGASLLKNATQFIDNNATELAAKMPPAFKQTMQDSKTLIAGLYADLLTFEQQKKQGGTDKIKANNTLYDTVIDICKDGQLIYKADPDTKEEFIFEKVVELSGGAHQTGFRGYTLNATTNQPIAGAIIKSTDGKYTTTTNDKGHFDFQQIAANTYQFVIIAEGFVDQTIDITLETGVTKTVTYKLTPITP